MLVAFLSKTETMLPCEQSHEASLEFVLWSVAHDESVVSNVQVSDDDALSKMNGGGDENGKMDKYIRQVTDYSNMMLNNSVLATMSPNSQTLYIDTLRKERKNIFDKMADGNRD